MLLLQTISQIKIVYAFVGESSETKSFIDNMKKKICYKQREGTCEGSWDKDVANSEFLFLGSHCMGWSCCS